MVTDEKQCLPSKEEGNSRVGARNPGDEFHGFLASE
jgi:hypothetical protein